MKKKLLIILNICLIFASCQTEKTFLTDYFSETQTCKLKEMTDYPADSIGHANFIFSHEDYIILSEPKLNYLLSSYNIATKSFTRFVPKGQGPKESLHIQQLGFYGKDSLFFIKDAFSKDISVYSFNNTSLLFREQIPSDNVSLFFDDNKIVCSKYGKKRFSLYDRQNESTVEFGDSIVMENYSPDVISHILTGLCAGNMKLNRIVWASIYGDMFEIYDYGNPDDIKTIISVKGIMPVIQGNQQNEPIFSIDSKFGIVSISATNKYIYMLYNENTIKDGIDKRDDVFLCNKILVYDWNGQPQKILKTDQFIRSISCNEKYGKIFCVGYDNENNGKILYYDL